MLPVGWLVAAVLAVALLAAWIALTVTRLERLHARVDAAWAALDAQLVRRAAAVQHLVDHLPQAVPGPHREEYAVLACTALDPLERDDPARRIVENAVGRATRELAGEQAGEREPAVLELREAAARVQIARRFYNDAVRDTRALRARSLPRLLRALGIAARRRRDPEFFDIDDTPPAARAVQAPPAPTLHHTPATEQDNA